MPRFPRSVLAALVAAAGLLSVAVSPASGSSAHPSPAVRPTVVLVHGAWADGSSWSAVTARLQSRGYTVAVEPNPLRGVASDALYLKNYLAAIPGPIVLVAHSYGGMVITRAATGNANVKALVYVDAYIPQAGDTVLGLTSAQPGSTLDPATTVDQVRLTDEAGNVTGVDLYVKPASFPAIFAGGVPAAKAAVLAAGQRPLSASALGEPFTGTPAWTTIPSWALVGTADRLIPPAEQQIMAVRAGAHVVKVNAPHLSMVSDPKAVTALITAAAGRR